MASLIVHLEIERCLPPQQSLTSEPTILKELLEAQRTPGELFAQFVDQEKVDTLRRFATLSREVVDLEINSDRTGREGLLHIQRLTEQYSAIEALLEHSNGQVTEAAANLVGEKFFDSIVSLSWTTVGYQKVADLRHELGFFWTPDIDLSNLTSPARE